MDLLNQLTDPNKKFVPMRIKSGLVDGRMKYESVEESDSSTSEDEEEKGVEYAKYFQEKEEAKYIESILNQDVKCYSFYCFYLHYYFLNFRNMIICLCQNPMMI